MKDEENLDQVLDQHLNGGKLVAPLDDTIIPLLAAAKLLAQLEKMAIPPEFAHRLEGALRVRSRNRSR